MKGSIERLRVTVSTHFGIAVVSKEVITQNYGSRITRTIVDELVRKIVRRSMSDIQ